MNIHSTKQTWLSLNRYSMKQKIGWKRTANKALLFGPLLLFSAWMCFSASYTRGYHQTTPSSSHDDLSSETSPPRKLSSMSSSSASSDPFSSVPHPSAKPMKWMKKPLNAKPVPFPFRNKNNTSAATKPEKKAAPAFQKADNSPQQLLGIMVTGGDVFTLHAWLHRHAAIFERLVIVNGGSPQHRKFVIDSTADYDNVVVVDQPKKMRHVTDQSLRSLAMQAFDASAIKGRWFMICQANEFWTLDPRELVDAVVQQANRVNIIRVQAVRASPMESEYKILTKLKLDVPMSFHLDIMSFSRFTMADGCTEDVNRYSLEDRFFQWGAGTAWGDKQHGIVVPKYLKPGRFLYSSDAFLIQFKLHDFTTRQIEFDNGGQSLATSLRTGTKPCAQQGWQGLFLDVSDSSTTREFPPKLVVREIADRCEAKLTQPKLDNCLAAQWTSAAFR